MARSILILMTVLFPGTLLFAQEKVKQPELSKVIDDLAAEDQKPYVRFQKGEINAEQAEKDFKETAKRNCVQLKVILKEHGFPSYAMVGKSSSHNFWMMVQHSDIDVDFQKEVLALMLIEVEKQNASGQDYAYLVDRVRKNGKEPQLYGTQIVVNDVNKGYELLPVEKPEELDKRRQQLGLPPIKEYLEAANKLHFEINKDKLKK